ncbi:MAG: translational GTPase TypA [Bacteroidales bacterium]|nr:translational GTPase TypA [Bacteroidales bacterium]
MLEKRNIAIIAHVDHGKTTLVDRILWQVKLFRENQNMGELILDSNDLERERGITILSKNVSVRYKDTKINIIDTPGHADFGGEVERVLNMADGVLLIVDAFEGPMPQTRFVLEKAIELGLKPIVVVNKVDKLNCNPDDTVDRVFDLMASMKATEDQLDFPVVFGSAKQGWMGADWKTPAKDVIFLLDTIIDNITPAKHVKGTTQMRITALDYSSYVGRIAIGRLSRGTLQWGQNVSLVKRSGEMFKTKIKELYVFEGLGKEKKKDLVYSGEIVALLGIENFDIGDTIADIESPEGLPPVKIDEPTMSMLFTINNSPFFGQDGKFVTSRHLRDRLFKEIEKNLALKVEETDSPDTYLVYGRGILHLSILVETMRREGYEFQLGQPKVIIKKRDDGTKLEPIELLTVHVATEFSGKVIELVTQRKGEIKNIESKDDRTHLDFFIPSRGIIGLRNKLLTATEGEAIIAHRFYQFQVWRGPIGIIQNGALIAMEAGTTIAYALAKLQDRGTFFVNPGEPVYEGQVIGENTRQNDIVINICKTKKQTNMRASGSDEKTVLPPPVKFSLEESMEYIRKDEYIEITPKSMRLRKILLKEIERKRNEK